jgi:hypothetical protein
VAAVERGDHEKERNRRASLRVSLYNTQLYTRCRSHVNIPSYLD